MLLLLSSAVTAISGVSPYPAGVLTAVVISSGVLGSAAEASGQIGAVGAGSQPQIVNISAPPSGAIG
jgi:hypothetical protein